jgi:methionyl-tRNA formyltransferase
VKTVFLGTSEFAAAVLRRLYHSPHRPSLVVSRPDSPQGRGRRLRPPPTAETAIELGLELFQPDSVNAEEARARIAAAAPAAVCVCAYGALIREPLLSDYRMLNVHPSLLPRWRGAAPIERAILAGDEITGVTIITLTAGLDSGPVCLQEEVEIEPDDDYGRLAQRLQTLGAEMLVQVLDESPPCVPQPEDGVTYAEKLTPADRRLDPTRPAAELARRVRALTPHVGAYVELPGGERLGVSRARVLEHQPVPAPLGETVQRELVPGELRLEPPRPVLGCVGGALELLSVQPPGRRPMPAEDYLRGHHR